MSGLLNYEPWPIDFAILDVLPDQGLIGGLHNKGKSVKAFVAEMNKKTGLAGTENAATSTGVSARCRVLREVGYAETFPATGGRIWARTPQGAEFLKKHKEEVGS